MSNLWWNHISKSHTDEVTKTPIFRVGDLVVLQKRCLHTHGSWDIWSFVENASNIRTDTSQSVFSDFFRCPHNCIFEYCAGHNGPNPSSKHESFATSPRNHVVQPFLVEPLSVLFLLPTHMLFPSPDSRHFSLTTCLKSSCITLNEFWHQNLVYLYVLQGPVDCSWIFPKPIQGVSVQTGWETNTLMIHRNGRKFLKKWRMFLWNNIQPPTPPFPENESFEFLRTRTWIQNNLTTSSSWSIKWELKTSRVVWIFSHHRGS